MSNRLDPDEMQICSASHPDPSTYGTLAVVLGELRVKYQIGLELFDFFH